MDEKEFAIKADCVSLVSEYLEFWPAPTCCREVTKAVKTMMVEYKLGPEYAGPLAYELEYETGIIC